MGIDEEIKLDVFVGDDYAFNYSGKPNSPFIKVALNNPIVIDVSELSIIPSIGDHWIIDKEFEYMSNTINENKYNNAYAIFALIVNNIVEHIKYIPRNLKNSDLVIAALSSSPTFVKVKNGK